MCSRYTQSSFTATFTTNTGSQTIMTHYRALQRILSEVREEYPVLESIQPTSDMCVFLSYSIFECLAFVIIHGHLVFLYI